MRLLLVFLLLGLVLLPDAEGWRRRRRRGWFKRVVKFAGKAYKAYKTYKQFQRGRYGRDANDLDLNKDGVIDQLEAEKVLDERAVKDFLPLLDEDGNSQVSVDEFTRAMRDLMTIDSDEDLRRAAEEDEDVDDLHSSE
ncbi:uncharacterized protein LOC124278758 [Haliotis rubra]|uniref:uncharacterized protein LOC124278758 n=1 Tax=Haliotis rubra TaxID=36100 RepID=UPI001EE50DCC|nr:uncharacterized protein LOC124278758 [Haliotis rubra]